MWPAICSTPVPTADAYIMKLILHDWNDDECVQILQNQYREAKPGGRVFIVEHVIPEPGHSALLQVV